MDTYRYMQISSQRHATLSIWRISEDVEYVCRGFMRIGAPFWMSFLAMFFVHGSFSYWTLPGWIPDPSFPIYTNKIHKVHCVLLSAVCCHHHVYISANV